MINQTDELFVKIANYVKDKTVFNPPAYETAKLCLLDALGCAIKSLEFPACTKLLGPIVAGTFVPEGSRVPGTSYALDPILGAFNIGTQIRWLDFNDTWLALEWGHPSDNLGALLALTDHLSRKNIALKKPPILIRDLLTALIKAYEIQGMLALENSFNAVGLDHVILVKTASAALSMQFLGGTFEDIVNVLTHVFVDGQSLRTYRHAPNTGSRKSWAAGDATSRAVQLAFRVKMGEMGYPSVLSTQTWGFQDVSFRGKPLKLTAPLNSYVIENILFKVLYPAEFHAQTAVECAIKLHEVIKNRIEDIKSIHIYTQMAALRIIDKKGPLKNPADRDHCLQYMVAVALLYGTLHAEHYEDEFAKSPHIDFLRERMYLKENPQYSQDYLDADKRSIANAIQIHFADNTATDLVEIHYPIGHPRRRKDALPFLREKFTQNVIKFFSLKKTQHLLMFMLSSQDFENMPVNTFMDLWTSKE